MNIVKIDHIAIAVLEGQKVAETWENILGLKFEGIEVLDKNGVKVFMIGFKEKQHGAPCIEFLEPLHDASPINNFLKTRGNGIHHICFETTDIEKDLDELKKRGVKLIDEKPRKGAHDSLIAFVSPKEFGGILIELMQSAINP